MNLLKFDNVEDIHLFIFDFFNMDPCFIELNENFDLNKDLVVKVFDDYPIVDINNVNNKLITTIDTKHKSFKKIKEICEKNNKDVNTYLEIENIFLTMKLRGFDVDQYCIEDDGVNNSDKINNKYYSVFKFIYFIHNDFFNELSGNKELYSDNDGCNYDEYDYYNDDYDVYKLKKNLNKALSTTYKNIYFSLKKKKLLYIKKKLENCCFIIIKNKTKEVKINDFAFECNNKVLYFYHLEKNNEKTLILTFILSDALQTGVVNEDLESDGGYYSSYYATYDHKYNKNTGVILMGEQSGQINNYATGWLLSDIFVPDLSE